MIRAMKYLISLAFLLICLPLQSAVFSNVDASSANEAKTILKIAVGDSDSPKAEAEFIKLAKRHKIPTRKLQGLKNVQNGFYLIAGAFGQQENALRFISTLKRKGLNAQSLYNPQNKLHYVHLARYINGFDAIKSHISGLDNRYTDPLWILQVEAVRAKKISTIAKEQPVTGLNNSIDEFKKVSKRLGVSNRVVRNMENISNGYYLIAGVFGEEANAKRQANILRRKSLKPRIFTASDNGMSYLYLKYTADWREAIKLHKNKLYGKYADKLWILAAQHPGDKAVRLTSEPKTTNEIYDDPKVFYALVSEKEIPTRSELEFSDLDSGYYLMAGVFGDAKNARTYLNRLKKKHGTANSVVHPQSKLHYVYLRHYKKGVRIVEDYLSSLQGSFKDPMWILHVNPPLQAVDRNSSADQMIPQLKETLNLSKPGKAKNFTQRTSKDPGYNDKLLEKADLYFDKMWYAEAAELYEKVLNENPENQSFDIIRKAGDSHYFNTNMERAFYWYDLLYNKYKSDMQADNLFKYAHSLKGTGKYSRAKRLMRLYNKALKEETANRSYRPRTNGTELDNILNTEEEMDIRNIGVNSEYSDFSPMFYQDNKVVFASAMDSAFFNTRRYKWNNQPYLDLYVASINKESEEVQNAVKFSKKINTKYHEASVTFSPDQQTIYFTRNNYGKKLKRDKKGINNLKIYMSQKIGDNWSEAMELPFNSDEYSTGHPALSPDGSKLYFVSDMPGSIGKTDLFVVDVLGDGQFSDPRNLGPEINTERREMFPFISDKKLYFASDGHIGLGGLDVYEVELGEEGFSEVRNMGKPINSKRDDFSYIIKEDTQKGFFASNRRGGKGDDDIYSFKRILPEEPNLNAIAGVVTEMVSGDVMPESLVVLLDENNIKLKEVETDVDGSFVFEDLESNTRYVIRTQKESYFEDEQFVTTEDNQKIDIEIEMKRLEERIVMEDGIKKLKTDMIYFDFDKYNIRKDAAEELDELVELMTSYPAMVIRIESHTDSRGKRAYNKYLSDKRAKSTREYLISKGIDPKRIESAIGYGEERLLNECNGSVRCSSAKHQLNRRSEFIIVNM